MTVSAMQDKVSNLLGDPNNGTWTDATHILPALNFAQDQFVISVLAYGQGNDNVFDALSELQTAKEITVGSSGYNLDDLNSSPGPVVRGGLISSKVVLDNETKWVARRPIRNLAQKANRYLKGSDERPTCYLLDNTYYLEVDSGSLNATVTLYYVREPKELVASGATGYQVATCELNGIYHELVSRMATAECHRMKGDDTNFNKYKSLAVEFEADLMKIALGGASEPGAEKTEAWDLNA